MSRFRYLEKAKRTPSRIRSAPPPPSARSKQWWVPEPGKFRASDDLLDESTAAKAPPDREQEAYETAYKELREYKLSADTWQLGPPMPRPAPTPGKEPESWGELADHILIRGWHTRWDGYLFRIVADRGVVRDRYTDAPIYFKHAFPVPEWPGYRAALRFVHGQWRALAIHEADELFQVKGKGPDVGGCDCRSCAGPGDRHAPFDPHAGRGQVRDGHHDAPVPAGLRLVLRPGQEP